jgi:hypothetical protein
MAAANLPAAGVAAMNETHPAGNLYGYTIRRNAATGRWEVFWKDKKITEDFASQAEAEEWIDDQMPLNR